MFDLNAPEALQLLRRAAEIDNGPDGLMALRKALAFGIMTPDQRSTWLELYRSHPAANTASQLDAAGIEITLDPVARPSVVRKTQELFRTLPLSERVQAAQWFLQNGEPRAVIEILPLSQAASGPKSFLLWIDAAMALGDWSSLEKALKSPSSSLDDPSRLPLLARAIKQQGRTAEANAVYAEALRATASNPEKRSEVLARLLAAGEWVLFENNIAMVVNDPKIAASAIRAWVPLAREQRSSARLLGFYEKALSSPVLKSDPYLLDRYEFCRLILGIPVPLEEVEARLAVARSNPNYLATAALGYLKNSRKSKAVHLLEGGDKPVDVTQMTPSRQAAVAAVLAANDRPVEARAIADRIPRQKLTVEEDAFLTEVLAKGGMFH
jgi:tetratricopeptide (TPR) repeat protein